ncbi:MAG: SPOR domain-containing protein [Gemmatimonadetes bacterium]|nr:SPOR domain-containing protein [Gemmatimonadota bacterium]
MRLSRLALVLATLLTLAACGGDEPEEAEIPRPASTLRPRADTTMGDTTAARAPGQPGAQAGRPGQPGGEPGAQPGRTAPAGGESARAGGEAGQPSARAGQPSGGATAPAPGQRLYTIQVAAFTSPDSARKWTGRLNSLSLPVWTSMVELGGTTYYRVRVGAVPTVSEARRLGSMLSQRFEWPVWVAPVTPADRLPDGAVESTRRVLEGD